MSSKSYFYNKHPNRSKSYYGKKRIYGSAYQPGQTTKYQRYGRTMRLDPGLLSIPRSLPTRQSQLRQVEELARAGIIPNPQIYNYNVNGVLTLPNDQYMAQGSTFTAVNPAPSIKYYSIRIPSNNTSNLNDLLKNNLNGHVDFSKVLGISVSIKFRSQASSKYLFVGTSNNGGTGWLIKITDTGSTPQVEGVVGMIYKLEWDGTDFIQKSIYSSMAISKENNASYPNQGRMLNGIGGSYFLFAPLSGMGTGGDVHSWSTIGRYTLSSSATVSGPANLYMCRGTIDESLLDWSLNNWSSATELDVLRNSEDSSSTWAATNLSLAINVIYY